MVARAAWVVNKGHSWLVIHAAMAGPWRQSCATRREKVAEHMEPRPPHHMRKKLHICWNETKFVISLIKKNIVDQLVRENSLKLYKTMPHDSPKTAHHTSVNYSATHKWQAVAPNSMSDGGKACLISYFVGEGANYIPILYSSHILFMFLCFEIPMTQRGP